MIINSQRERRTASNDDISRDIRRSSLFLRLLSSAIDECRNDSKEAFHQIDRYLSKLIIFLIEKSQPRSILFASWWEVQSRISYWECHK